MKKSIAFKIILALCTVCLIASLAEAAWWDVKGKFPLPKETRQEKEENRKLAYGELDFFYYISGLEQKEIAAFYRAKLAELGWQEANPLADLGRIQEGLEISVPPQDKGVSDMLVFRKDLERIVVRFVYHLPYPPGIKCRYIFAKNNVDTQKLKNSLEVNPYILPLVTQRPKLEVTPVYPDSRLVALQEKPDSQHLVYFIPDGLEPVATFYKMNMPQYGWQLDNEGTLEKTNFDKEFALKELMQAGMQSRKLTFSNAAGDSCKVFIFRLIPQADSRLKYANQTVAAVSYEKK